MKELDYHRALQDVYKKAMGEVRTYDRIHCLKYDWIQVANDCDYSGEGCSSGIVCQHRVFTPLTIDDRNSERGLWGMLKGLFVLRNTEDKEWQLGIVGRRNCFIADTPTLTILKALAAQEGVELYPRKTVVVPSGMSADTANAQHGDRYGIDWKYSA